MIANNYSCTRLLFLCAYVVCAIGQFMIILFIAERENGGLDIEKIAQDVCDAMTEEEKADYE